MKVTYSQQVNEGECWKEVNGFSLRAMTKKDNGVNKADLFYKTRIRLNNTNSL